MTNPNPTFQIIITCADGLESALQIELASFDHPIIAQIERTGRLIADVGLSQIYTVCLWSRVASRVLLPLLKADVNPNDNIAEQLYTLSKQVAWQDQFSVQQTFAIRLSVDKRLSVNQQFAMLRIKDAIADRFNETLGCRPNVAKHPDFAIFATVNEKQFELYHDLSGVSLHRRGYRVAMTDAPLKENLAAALLYQVGWQHKHFDAIIDPMCGSGTLLIEALYGCLDYPVGLDKVDSQFGFLGWQHHDQTLWQTLVAAAQQKFHHALALAVDQAKQGQWLNVVGFDVDSQAIKATHSNLLAAGLGQLMPFIQLQQRPLASLLSSLQNKASHWRLPLIITNPPYGERLSEEMLIKPLYQGFGKRLQQLFAEQTAYVGVLSAKIEQADVLPLIEPKTLRCHNGAMTIYFRHGQLKPQSTASLLESYQKQEVQIAEAQDFVNRLQKKLAQLKRLANKQHLHNLRLYDADLPDFNMAIDVYGDFVHVQEYAPPKSIPLETAKKRFQLALHGIKEVLNVSREQVFIKTRAKQSGNEQYSKKGNTGKFYVVDEPSVASQTAYFLVNFSDYLDIGLFLDHRPMRQLIGEQSRNKEVLNLFAYTCTASVHAALAGAKSVTSVDLSQNYLDWGRKNFALNGLPEHSRYQFIAADVFDWIKTHSQKYDVIFIDPPTFSNSKKFKGTFDVQRDHAALINRAMNRLNPNGVLYFSNNFRKFVLDQQLSQRYQVENITHQTLGFDFDKKNPIHQAWKICHPIIGEKSDHKARKSLPNRANKKAKTS